MKRQIAKGAAWMILLRLADRTLGLISTLVLARLLLPADFGVVAMAMSFIALIELASAFSFEIALIQRADPTRAHFDTAWTLNLGFALLCAALIALAAPLASRFYSEPRLTAVMLVLAAGWAMQGFENIGIVNFRRRMEFSREFAFMFGKRIVAFFVTLALAYAWQSYWALIAGQLTMRMTGVGLSYAMEAYRPRLSLAARADLFSFSGWLLVTNVLGFGLGRLPHFVVGRTDGSAALGLFTIASEFARLPSTELSAPINRAVLPGLSRLTGDIGSLRRVFSEVMGMTVAVTLPASIGLAIIATLLVEVLLGARWLAAAPLMAVLALAGAVEVVSANNGVAYLALGNARLVAALSATKLIVMVSLALLLVPRFGVTGMAYAELGSAAIVAGISFAVLRRALVIPLRVLGATLWRPVVASAAMGVALLAALQPVHAFGAAPAGVLKLVLTLLLGAGTYTVCLFTLWFLSGRPDGAEATLLGHARRQLAKLRPA